MIKHVLWDVGNVVVWATHDVTFAVLRELGVRSDKAKQFFSLGVYGEFARGKISGAEFAGAVRFALEAPHLTDGQIRAAHDAHIYMVDEGMVRLLEEIRLRGVRQGFVTTTNVWQTERERELVHLAENYGPVVRSHEMQMSKTDTGAWPRVLLELGLGELASSGILFIDDGVSNIAAAREAGLTTLFYDPTPVLGVQELRRRLVELGLL